MTQNRLGVRGIRFVCHVLDDRFRHFATRNADLFQAAGFDPIASIWVGSDIYYAETGLAPAFDQVEPAAGRADGLATMLQFTTETGVNGDIRTYPVADTDGVAMCTVELRLIATLTTPFEAGLAFQRHCVDFCRSIQSEFRIHSAELRHEGDGLTCLPDVALVDGCSHIAIASGDEVDELYAQPDEFWSAGWAIEAEHGGQRLLSRDLDLIAGPDYLARIIGHQWAMARAAKPWQTGYSEPKVRPEEEAIFRAGPPRLDYAEYFDDGQTIEYSGLIAGGQHVQGWEIFGLRAILETGKAAEVSSPVKAVRIVFAEQWMAESEKRPLLDIGCAVAWRGSDGALNRIED